MVFGEHQVMNWDGVIGWVVIIAVFHGCRLLWKVAKA